MQTEKFGFIEPDHTLSDLPIEQLHKHLNIPIYSGHKAKLSQYFGINSVFDAIVNCTEQFNHGYEDQCSTQYYFDLFNCIRSAYGEITRVVEVGVFMGGASSILAGCGLAFGLELDLVDINPKFLRFSHERIRRSFIGRDINVRLFHGDLPTYVRDVLSRESAKVIVQHDGAHDFNQVVRDLGSLFYVQNKIHSLAIQDTHLRGMPSYFNFVDSAVHAIFGFNLNFKTIGTSYSADNKIMTSPNQYQGNYFMPDTAEGMYIPFEANRFMYPHPSIPLDAFFPAPVETKHD